MVQVLIPANDVQPQAITLVKRFMLACLPRGLTNDRVAMTTIYRRFVRWCEETGAKVLDTKVFVLNFKTCADQYGLRVVREREKFYVAGVKLVA